ncbi:hypothetical protein DOY81_013160 [Sarcophaga bullata]|nr:hypothetical protein DOY81_013160 [Sarcophaga bullata]
MKENNNKCISSKLGRVPATTAASYPQIVCTCIKGRKLQNSGEWLSFS